MPVSSTDSTDRSQPAVASPAGKVFIIGAGPGEVAYLTVRAQQCLRQADALMYDALVDPAFLQVLPAGCEQLPVGKRGGQPSTPQSTINQLLVQLCQQGKTVVRLKSGDPFIFGRTTAEIQALQTAGCAFEVIPGVSAALAAPLLEGIPLTDPVLSRGFGVFTAHDLDALDWPHLSRLETLVFLMGGRGLADICQRLQRYGQRGETPVAVIQWAGQSRQRVWQGTVLSIAQKTKGVKLSPCVIVVGEVVRLRDYLRPSVAPLPLSGQTLLVTRATGQSSEFTQLLVAQGASVIEMPALEIVPAKDLQPLDAAIGQIASYDWLILTSANAVTFFLDRLRHLGFDLRALAGVNIAVVGRKTAKILNERGLTPDFIPPDYIADALVEHFPVSRRGLKVLFPRVAQGGRPLLVKAFREQGAQVDEVAAYDSVCPGAIAPAAFAALQSDQITTVTFASSKTVRHFVQLMAQTFGVGWLERLAGVAIASIGPQTSATCHELLGRVDIEATDYTLEGLTGAIVHAVQDP
ncbi:MAG: uroporphyrinogen-III C-methyltransferase [Cyanobacteria bacterium P01_D01_bin.14]